MEDKEKLKKIIEMISAANSGKQLEQRYKGDRKFFKRKVYEMTFDSFYRDIYKVSEFKENIPKLTEAEYFFVIDVLNWVKNHNLGYEAGGRSGDIDSIVKKLRNRNISEEKGKYSKLLKVLRGMKQGKQYEYKDLSGWSPVTLSMNIYPLNELVKEGKVREKKGN